MKFSLVAAFLVVLAVAHGSDAAVVKRDVQTEGLTFQSMMDELIKGYPEQVQQMIEMKEQLQQNVARVYNEQAQFITQMKEALQQCVQQNDCTQVQQMAQNSRQKMEPLRTNTEEFVQRYMAELDSPESWALLRGYINEMKEFLEGSLAQVYNEQAQFITQMKEALQQCVEQDDCTQARQMAQNSRQTLETLRTNTEEFVKRYMAEVHNEQVEKLNQRFDQLKDHLTKVYPDEVEKLRQQFEQLMNQMTEVYNEQAQFITQMKEALQQCMERKDCTQVQQMAQNSRQKMETLRTNTEEFVQRYMAEVHNELLETLKQRFDQLKDHLTTVYDDQVKRMTKTMKPLWQYMSQVYADRVQPIIE